MTQHEADPKAPRDAWLDAARRLDGSALERLLTQEADINHRDHRGKSALDHCFAGIPSGLESNMMADLRDGLLEGGYRGDLE